MEKGNGHVSFLALFTGHRFKLAFHPQASFSLWKSSLNIGRLRGSVPDEPFPGVSGPMQSLCGLHVAHQVEMLWESLSELQGKVGMPEERRQLCSPSLRSKTPRHGSEFKGQSHSKILFSNKHCPRCPALFACPAAIFLSSGKSNPVLFWQPSTIRYHLGSIINQSVCLALRWPRGQPVPVAEPGSAP